VRLFKGKTKDCLEWIPHAGNCFSFTRQNTRCIVGFGFAGRACVLDFFAVFLGDCCYGFVFKVNEFSFKLERFLGAFLDAFAAAAAFVRVDYYVVFA